MTISPLPAFPSRELAGFEPATNFVKPGALKGLAGAELTAGAAQPDFTNFLQKAVSEVDGKMQAANVEKAKVLSGDTNNLHQAMISMQEASVAFSLMVEVRNKLVESYQEVMRMQV